LVSEVGGLSGSGCITSSVSSSAVPSPNKSAILIATTAGAGLVFLGTPLFMTLTAVGFVSPSASWSDSGTSSGASGARSSASVTS